MTKKIQTYTGKRVTVHFDPQRCMHAGKCVQELPQVFNTEARPWILPDAADASVVAEKVLNCPSGALTCEVDGMLNAGRKPSVNAASVMPDGPLYMHAEMSINGEEQLTCRAALCRCGATKNPPFCDGAHKKTGFKDNACNISVRINAGVKMDGKLEIISIQDGPLMIRGGCEVRNIKGKIVALDKELFFCRCGASESKPFCDGSHNKTHFRSE